MFFYLRGGAHKIKISNFSQIQKSSKYPGGRRGGGQENCGLFPLFVTFFNSEASLTIRLAYPLISSLKIPVLDNSKILSSGVRDLPAEAKDMQSGVFRGFIKMKNKAIGNISKSRSLNPEKVHFKVDSTFNKVMYS